MAKKFEQQTGTLVVALDRLFVRETDETIEKGTSFRVSDPEKLKTLIDLGLVDTAEVKSENPADEFVQQEK